MAVKQNLKYECSVTAPGGTDNLISRVVVNSQITLLSISGDTNDEPGGDQSTTFPIRISGTRKYGIIARHIVIARIQGAGATASREYRRIPILTEAFFKSSLSTIADSISYESLDDWFLVGGIGERYHLLFGVA